MPGINLLNIFLLCSGFLAPFFIFALRRLSGLTIEPILKITLRYWLLFILIILCLRVLLALFLTFSHISLSGIDHFYPIRIAYPNYGLLRGLPYVLICVAILIWFEKIQTIIINSRFSYFLIWIFAVILLLLFGAIHGGFISGNAWIATSDHRLFDVSINNSLAGLFTTHVDRILGLMTPSYRAPHTTSHPAAALAYMQILIKYTSPLIFSFINVTLLSLAFPIAYWVLRRSFSDLTALQTTLFCLLVPGILVYGRSDDVVYYALALISFALMSIAIKEKQFGFTIISSVLFFIAMNFSYAALILLPAMFSLNTDFQLYELFRYIRRIFPHLIVLLIVTAVLLFCEERTTNYLWFKGFYASDSINAGSAILAMIKSGRYAEVINDRIMAACDFLIFSGPVFLYLFVYLIKNRSEFFLEWKIKNVGLFVMLAALLINSNGPGEISRPWGSLFLLIAFSWFPILCNKESQKTPWSLIRVQFLWALLLKTFLNFGW